MGITLCSLASGSKGNSIYITDGKTSVLVDAGINCRELMSRAQKSGADIGGISAVISTHCHSDHCKGMAGLIKKTGAPVFVHREGAQALLAQTGLPQSAITTFNGNDFIVGTLSITPLKLSHDVPHCSGFLISGSDSAAAVIMDLGELPDNILQTIRGADMVVIESNHDRELLQTGRYPYFLKRRIMSAKGHLSNDECASACGKLLHGGTKRFMLAHLSEENNYPELAYTTFVSHMSQQGIGLSEYTAEIAFQHKPTKLMSAK